MEIIVQGNKINTKDIWNVVDIEKGKKMFLNREAGFIIRLNNGSDIKVGQRIAYESYPSEIRAIKDKWSALEKQVREKWQSDKSHIPVFKV